MILPILWIFDLLQDSHRTDSRKLSKASAAVWCTSSPRISQRRTTTTIFKWCIMSSRPRLNSNSHEILVARYPTSRQEQLNRDRCLHQEPTRCRDNCNKWKGFALLVSLRSSTWGGLSPGRVRRLTRIETRFLKDCLAAFAQLRPQHLKNLALLSAQAEYKPRKELIYLTF